MPMPRPQRQSYWFRKARVLTQWAVGLRVPDFGSVYLAYHPDSYTMVRAQPEFRQLLRRFTRFNRRNNGGDIHRLWTFILNLQQILADDIPGDFAELGVWRGNTASILAHYAQLSGRRALLFDTFGTYHWLYVASAAIGLAAAGMALAFPPASRSDDGQGALQPA